MDTTELTCEGCGETFPYLGGPEAVHLSCPASPTVDGDYHQSAPGGGGGEGEGEGENDTPVRPRPAPAPAQ